MYHKIFQIANIVLFFAILLCVLLLLYKIILHIVALFPAKKFDATKKEHNFAILIPARNESKVIRGILESIKNQTYNKDKLHTYIIVEKEDDKTIDIAKEYANTEIIIRKHLEQKGKGHALDEAFQQIPKNNNFDAFFIFDADNILDSKYIEEMNKVFAQGYEIAIGYRNTKNWNDNWISACSGITFSIFNIFDNKPRSKLGLSVRIFGTGFYVSKKIINSLNGWKFFTLTEDYEFTLYSCLNSIKSTYNENAKFDDEQPTKIKQSISQRLRWCKGFTQASKLYNKKLINAGLKNKGKIRIDQLMTAMNVIPWATILVSIISYQLFCIVLMIIELCNGYSLFYYPLISAIASFFLLYILISLYTFCIILLEHKKINLKKKNAFFCIILNPIFVLLYLPIFLISIFKKEVEWVAIEHNKNNLA